MSDPTSKVRQTLAVLSPKETLHKLLAENDALIRERELDNGRLISTQRTAIYTTIVAHWVEQEQRKFGYEKAFALVALGGTGRGEMSPCSDLDFALLFDDSVEGNKFLHDLQRKTIHTREFEKEHGFSWKAQPFAMEDADGLKDKQLNAFLDMVPLHDPSGLAVKFRENIRSHGDAFEHFLHVRSVWLTQWQRAAAESERLDLFDIKNDGLRVFLAGIWTLACREFEHSHDIYRRLDDPRDLAAYDFLMRIRSFVHLRRGTCAQDVPGGNHPEDLLKFDDFLALGEVLGQEANERERFEFANTVRARLLAARRRVASFAKGIIEQELRQGRRVRRGSPIVLGAGGMVHADSALCRTPQAKSSAALSLLLTSQRYGLPVDPAELQATFRNAGDWLVRVPDLAALFSEARGSLAKSFEFLSQIDGAEERLFPGYAKFETSLDSRILEERQSLRSALERNKMQALERFIAEGQATVKEIISKAQLKELFQRWSVEVESTLLDADHLAAIRLALKTKRLPLTSDDIKARQDDTLPLHERFSSGFSDIPLDEYYERFAADCDFSRDVLRLTEFLITNRRAFTSRSEAGMQDQAAVEELHVLCSNEHRLRSLFVFTHADRTEWHSLTQLPARWFNIRELYGKTMAMYHPAGDPTDELSAAGFAADQVAILKDFGPDFFGGRYRIHANRFGSALLNLAEDPKDASAKALELRDETSRILGVAAHDYPGLAATITGALFHQGVELLQAHLFSAAKYHLALDFFHVTSGPKPLPAGLCQEIVRAIRDRAFISEEDEATLPKIVGHMTLSLMASGLCRLRFETAANSPGIVYALTCKIHRRLRGNIYALNAQVKGSAATVNIYHTLGIGISLTQAQEMMQHWF